MQPNFEKENKIKNERDLVAENINSELQEQGYWMNEVDLVNDDIRFQIWKDENGNPMTHNDGVKNIVEQIINEKELIPESAEVKYLQMGGGGVTISITLAKST